MGQPLVRLFAAAFVLAGCRSSPVADTVVAPPPQPGVDVLEVVATLDVTPEPLALEGAAVLEVAVPDTLTRVALGLDDALEVATVTVDGAGALFWRDGDALWVPLDGASSPVRIEVAYRGTPTAGVYAEDFAGQRVVYTDGWPDRTAGWLPTVHHPSDPAHLDLTLSVPDGLEVVASGVAVLDSVAGGRRVVRSVLEGDAPPYTFAWAVGDFDVTTQGADVPVRHAVLEGESAAGLARTPAAMSVLSEMLGPYPYASYATVQVPMTYAGMENAAAPFLRADLYSATAPGRTPVEEVNLHELVHQWWGNDIVPADWRDLWLAEGAATYFTAEAYRKLDGDDAGRNFLTLMSRAIGPEDAARRLAPATYDDPADVLTPTVYQKGGSVFHLLRLTLGEDVFYRAVRRIQVDYADRPLSTAAFRSALEDASGRDLGPLFERWVTGQGLPTLAVSWDRATRTLSWSIEDDAGTLEGVPFELRVSQGDQSWFVPATDGVFSPPGDRRPDVEPVGILLTVED